MLRRKPTIKKTPVKGEPQSKVKETLPTVCSVCSKTRPYANKSRKMCAVCVKKDKETKLREKKEKARKKKSESISFLTKKLDRIFSVYIRLKGTKPSGECKCFTCDKVLYWREIQCGHFQSRRFMTTRFHELNCKPQCYACNIGLSGNQYIFGVNLDKEHGVGTAEMMVRKSREQTKMVAQELMELNDKYEATVEELRKDKNIWT